jgi:nitroreductase
MNLNLSVDDVLTTTRSVRKRLDLEKPVPREVLMECLDLALQAPTGSNSQGWQWVFVDDPEKKKALADIYRHNATPYLDRERTTRGDLRDDQIGAVMSSAKYLNEHLHEVPVMLVPCLEGSPDDAVAGSAGFWGSLLPAVWSYMLARPRVGVDDPAPRRQGREAGRRGPRYPVRAVPPGRPVPDRLHQGHRVQKSQAPARRAVRALERVVVRPRR